MEFVIAGIFDNDPEKIGTKIKKLQIQDIKMLPAFVNKTGTDIGIITVPPAVAQQVTDLLIISGIKGILNLTATHIVSPGKVPVVDLKILNSLLELSCKILSNDKK